MNYKKKLPIALIPTSKMGVLSGKQEYFELGCEVKALGRGHIQRIKKEVKNNK